MAIGRTQYLAGLVARVELLVESVRSIRALYVHEEAQQASHLHKHSSHVCAVLGLVGL